MWALVAAVAAATMGAASSGAMRNGPGGKWHPHPPVAEPSVPGHKTVGKAASRPAPLAVAPVTAPAWPAAASADVTLAGPGSTPVPAPGTPISLSLPVDGTARTAVGAASAGVSVHVSVADHAAAQRAGIAGTMVSAARTDAGAAATSVALRLDYSGFRNAFGGSFSDRLRLVALPACALTTPEVAACRVQTPVRFVNDRVGKALTATVALPAATGGAAAPVVFAAASAPGSGNGDYTATPLKASDTWTVNNSGSFSYTYPMTAPPALAGVAPQLGLGYSSATLDGQTANANSQGSQIGDGWGSGNGFIEKSFTPCAKVPGAPDAWKSVGDVCQGIPNATLSMPGHAGELVHDNNTGTWRIAGDDGSRVEALTGADNGDSADNYTYWRLTTADGTQYYFGANRLPAALGGTGSDAPTYSAWGEPVFGTGAGTACNDPTSASVDPNACRAGWRWNLDFVIDPHGNVIRYDYLREYNFYTHVANGALVQYTSAGYLSQIEYGFRTPDVVAGLPPAARVNFALVPRCIFDGGPIACPSTLTYPGPGLVSAGITSANDATFQDVPADQLCASTGHCGNVAPTFFQTARLSTVATQVRVNGTFTPVDSWELEQHWLTPTSGDTALGLDAVTHTGLSRGQRTQLPDVTFSYQFFDNRAQISPVYASQGPSSAPRMTRVDTELGGDIRVSYDNSAYPCTGTAPVVDANGTLCFPEFWVKPGDMAPSVDWFNKQVVTKVQADDNTKLSGSAGQGSASSVVTTYSYPSPPAWHSNDSEQTPKAYRTFDQFRGFGTVVTVTGDQIDPNAPAKGIYNTLNTKTVTTYLRGMDQDPNLAGVSAPVTVTDARGEFPNTVDDNALADRVFETRTFDSADASALVLSDVIDHPVLSAPTAVHTRIDTLPKQRARFQHTGTEVTYTQVTTGMRRTEKDYTFDDSLPSFTGTIASGGNGRQIAAFDKGDTKVPQLCTRTWYANTGPAATADIAQRTGLADLVTTSVIPAGGSCTWTPTPPSAGTANAEISGTRTTYDDQPWGQATGPGNVTGVEAESGNDGHDNATWITKTSTPAAMFDVYGRPLQVTDADSNTTATAYTPADHALPTSVAVTASDPATGAVGTWAPEVTTLDPGRGQPLTVTDTNGHTTTVRYDGLGRTTAVWRPGRATTASANVVYSYSLAGPGGSEPSFVDTDTLTDAAGDTTTAYTIVDGLGRTQETQTTPADGSAGQVVTQTSYDPLGRPHLATGAFYDASNAPSGAFTQYSDPTQIPAVTRTDYDLPAHTTAAVLLGHNQPLWSTLTHIWGADRTDVIPPAGGTAASTITDARGRTTALWQYHANPPTLSGTGADSSAADVAGYTYGYNSDDTATVTVTDATGANTWTTTTDLLGRIIRSDDPNSGSTRSTFDNAGLLLSSTDGRGVSLYNSWDHLGRKTGEYSAPITGNPAVDQPNQLAGWSYDTVLKGRPASSTRYVGGSGATGLAYTSAITGYDVANRPTATQESIPTSGPDAALGGLYQSTIVYTVTGQVDHYTLPAVPAAHLAAVTVTNKYTPTGALVSAHANTGGYQDLLDDSELSPFGEITSRTVGEAPYQVIGQYAYDQATRRLVQSFTDASAGTSDTTGTVISYDVAHISYTYNAAGQLTSANNQQGSGTGGTSTDVQCYNYDPLGRLLYAWTDNAGTTPAPATSLGTGTALGGIGGCTTAIPSVATTANAGPAPYWQDFAGTIPGMATDAMGNRVTVTDHATTVGGTDTIHTYSGYANPGTRNTLTSGSSAPGTGPGPHLLGTVTTTGSATGGSTDTFAFDGAGNTTVRQISAKPGANAASQTLTWDPEGRLAQVADTASHTTAGYLYDAAGTQLIRRDTDTSTGQTTSTLYLGATEIHLSGGTVTAQRYFAFLNAPTTIVSSDGTVAVETGDTHGTADTTIDATPGHPKRGTITARRYTKPFGETRGATPQTFGTFPDDHTFLGKTSDRSTGLIDIGARKYDSAVGRFISGDPEFQPHNPQVVGGYAYAGNDPVSASDPSGLRTEDKYYGPSDTNTGGGKPAMVDVGGGLYMSTDDSRLSSFIDEGKGLAFEGANSGAQWRRVELSGWLGFCQEAGTNCGSGLTSALNSQLNSLDSNHNWSGEDPVAAFADGSAMTLPGIDDTAGEAQAILALIDSREGHAHGFLADLAQAGMAIAPLAGGGGSEEGQKVGASAPSEAELSKIGQVTNWLRSLRGSLRWNQNTGRERTAGGLEAESDGVAFDPWRDGLLSGHPYDGYKPPAGVVPSYATHVEPQAAAIMDFLEIKNADLYISKGYVCDTCFRTLPDMLPTGANLTIHFPGPDSPLTFTGN